MKAKTKKRLLSISKKVGIDFDRFKDPLLTDKIADLVSFPIYATKTIIIPIVVLLILNASLCFWFYTHSKVGFGWLTILALLGLLQSLFAGFLFGL